MRRWMGLGLAVMLTACGGDDGGPTKPPDDISREAPALVLTIPDVDLGTHGLTTAPDGTIFVGGDAELSATHRYLGLCVYSSAGAPLRVMGPSWVTSLAYGPDGNLYLTEYGEDQARGILKLTPDGALLDYWAGRGSAEGQFAWGNRGIAVGPDGLLYICDTGNNRIQVLRTDGTFVRQFGASGDETTRLLAPKAVAVSQNGNVFVADTGRDRVACFRSAGQFVRAWGGNGKGDGLFTDPRGIAVGPDGAVYVADTGNRRVQKFTPDGEFLVSWESYATAIAVDADGRILVGGGGVRVFAYP